MATLTVRAVSERRTMAVAVPTMADALRMAAGMIGEGEGPWRVTVTDRRTGDVLGLIEA